MEWVARRRVASRTVAAVTIAAGTLAAGLAGASPAAADGPGVGAPWVVSVGDSYISGEAGRWAGNSNSSAASTDALGASAYWDNASGTGEQIARCHRSRSNEAAIGTAQALDLACSGAKTTTDASGQYFKPGLDFYADASGRQGQAAALQAFARTHNVSMVPVSIGGNDFNFASVVTTCVEDFLTSPSWWPNYCNDDSSVKANFTAANVAAVTARIRQATLNVRTAMSGAGYADAAYTILVQDYESPIPTSSGFRYGQSGYGRQFTGGCGFWNADANWANQTALPTIDAAVRNAASQTGLANVKQLELAGAFNGRRLCENTVGLLEERGVSSWRQTGAVDKAEWVNQIRTVSTVGSNYYVQESLHPNYWGQLALRNCVRQAFNGGAPRGGTCTRAGSGLTSEGEPVMALG